MIKNYNSQVGGKKTTMVIFILICSLCCWSCILSGGVGVFGGPQFIQKFTTSYRKITGQYKETRRGIKKQYSSSQMKKLAKCATIGGGINDAKKGECCGNHANCKTRYCDKKTGAPVGFCIYDWPRLVGQPCSFHEDCSGYGTGTTDNACCDGTCKKKSKKNFMDLFGSCP
jgi:hypothetical protein